MHPYIPGKILDGIQVFIACHEDSGDLLMYTRNDLTGISYIKETLLDLCTMEMLMNKAKYHREPASLNHNLLPQPEFIS